GRAAVDVDPQHGAEQGLRVLPVGEGVPGPAAVAHADIEQAVGAEAEPAAIVVGRRLLHRQQQFGGGGVGHVRVGGHTVADDAGVPAPVGVVDEEAAVAGVVGV